MRKRAAAMLASACAAAPAAAATASAVADETPERTAESGPRVGAAVFRSKVGRIPDWGRSHLRSIAWCESRNNPRAIGGGGVYRGLYQFSFSTWRAVGGRDDPAAAPRAEQTWRAWRLLKNHGPGHWPVCG